MRWRNVIHTGTVFKQLKILLVYIIQLLSLTISSVMAESIVAEFEVDAEIDIPTTVPTPSFYQGQVQRVLSGNILD